MNNSFLKKVPYLIVLLLVGCGGGGSSEPVTPVTPIIEPVKKDTITIYNNTDYTSLNGASSAVQNHSAVIVKAVYSQESRERVNNCQNCFTLIDSVIIGDDMECEDCLRLSSFLDYTERDHSLKTFIVIEDDLTLTFAQEIVSTRGYSDIIFVSSSDEILDSIVYNYELALIGESSKYEWNITTTKDCPSKCIHPLTNNNVAGDYDGVIVN